MTTTSKFGITEMESGQSQKEITHNEALRIIDTIMHPRIIDKDLTTPPGSPVDGGAYIIASIGGGWSTFAVDDIAHYISGNGWIGVTPAEGMQAYVIDESIRYQYGSANGWGIFRAPIARTEVSTAAFSATPDVDSYLGVLYSSTGAVNIHLASGIDGAQMIIKDEANKAGTNNITVSAAPGQLIGKASSTVIDTSGGSKTILFIGGIWSVISQV